MKENFPVFKLVLVFTLIAVLGCRQSYQPAQIGKVKTILDQENLVDFKQFRIDTLFESNQIINLITVDEHNLNKLSFDFLFEKKDLITTSKFAEKSAILAAVNAGFFDMENGGSITYLEVEDETLGATKDEELFNGAIVLDDRNQIRIEEAKADSIYEESMDENGVLIAGPVLLINGVASELPDRDLVGDRHPRTCVCKTSSALLLVAIDGRTLEAAGMTLKEVQEFLLSKKCIDAINLDGGGSTTMWLQNKGVVNYPSDITGERPVANVLAISLRE